ncbi:alpha/beta-hydrolase [Atractiella rhizophila]|nr:alpha/beta-hydrolase [Atractiella rhizophila]
MVSLRSLICVFSILIISSGAPSADPASKLEERQGCTAVKILCTLPCTSVFSSLRGSDETIPGHQTRQSFTIYDSESQGVALLRAQLATAKASCPIVVMGYSQGAQVVADVLQSRSTGTDLSKSWLSPRGPGALNAFSSVLQSYCLVNDPVCARGGNINDHLVVVSTYQNQAASFALGKIGG